MVEYINKEEAYRTLNSLYNDLESLDEEDPELWVDGFNDCIGVAIDKIEDIPAADVVPVVRCKDCVHYSNNNLKSQLDRLGYCLLNEEITDDKREPSDFCSYGERKGNENG